MGKQHNKIKSRKRRQRYLKRKKTAGKTSGAVRPRTDATSA